MQLTKQIMFEAGSDAEALEIARQKLGRDAVILSSQVVKKGGFLGLFRKRSLLVTAGILEEDEPQGVQTKQERLIAFQQLLEAQKRSSADKLELSEKAKSGEMPALLEGIKEIRSILTRIENQKVQRSSDEPPQEKSPFYQQLLSAGVESHLAQKLLKDYEASGAQDAIQWLSGYIRVIGGDFASALGGAKGDVHRPHWGRKDHHDSEARRYPLPMGEKKSAAFNGRYLPYRCGGAAAHLCEDFGDSDRGDFRTERLRRRARPSRGCGGGFPRCGR